MYTAKMTDLFQSVYHLLNFHHNEINFSLWYRFLEFYPLYNYKENNPLLYNCTQQQALERSVLVRYDTAQRRLDIIIKGLVLIMVRIMK